jgi:hypothetical protein
VNGQEKLREESRPEIFPFFVGCARSGTTLLRAMFTSHPDLAIPDETHYFSDLITQQGRYAGKNGFAADLFLADLLSHRWFPRLGVSQDDVQGAVLAQPPPSSYAEAVRRVFAVYAKHEGKPRYGDKTPRNVMQLEIIAESFPEARFIHIIRDGRDVALSMSELPWGPQSTLNAARAWRQMVKRGRRAGQSLGPSRYREIQYEQLLEDPQAVVRSLCQFIELPFHPMMLQYFERAEQIIAPSPSTRGRVAMPLTKGLRDWRTQMSRNDLVTFELIGGRLLEEVGYERGASAVSLRESMATRAAILAVDMKAQAGRIARSVRRMARLVRRRGKRVMGQRDGDMQQLQ